ncbi:MAG: LysM peptidoglycan-binding domain-containing protein [Salibacteraceae bacterium]|nr:LysM peptidoglycan-binding domain-containing protein [Salibacteraceae bacterium]MDP4845333.1 LysM peptidoglycan-binding domain-containing protein [Salibacteraceae bacterium]
MGIIRINISAFIFGLLLLVANVSFAQDEAPQVHKINGKKYYLHIVEPGNTVYGISRKYELTVEELKAENPIVVTDGLKVNQTLLIPVTKDNKKEISHVEEQTDQNFITYEVGEKETLYSLSKKYNTTLEAILAANPEVKDGLKAGTSIKIPYADIETKNESVVTAAKHDSLKGHVVAKGETLYALSKKYDVKQVDLIEANNGLPFGLKEGMLIRIPGTFVAPPVSETFPEIDTDFESIFKPKVPASFQRITIALMLPLNSIEPDSVNPVSYQIAGSNRIPLSFLRGFQFAVDSLVESTDSLSLDIRVFDLPRDTVAARAIMNKPDFRDVDIVVGPFFTDQFQYVSDVLASRGIPVICPIAKPSRILFNRSNAIKMVPSESMQLQSLAELLASEYADSNVVVVNSRKMEDVDNISFLKTRLAKAKNLPDSALATGIKEMTLWDVNYETITMRMRESGSYVFVVPSKNNVFVTQFISELYNVQFRNKGKYHITLIGLEDWLKIEDNLDINHLQKLNVTLMLPSYLDYNNYRVKQFFSNYYKANGYEPNEYTAQGFDMASYLINALSYHGETWFKNPEKTQFQGLLSDYSFKRIMDKSGVEATGIKLYRYEHFKMKEVGKWPLQKMK